MKLALTTILIAMATLFIYSCGDDGDKTTNNDKDKDARTGITKCGEDINQKNCKAGQYCENETFGTCANGCLSDDNCLSNQTCKKTGEQVGVCENKEVTPTCTAGAKRCNGNTIETCTNDAWTTSQTCSGTMTCDAATTTCKSGNTGVTCDSFCSKVVTCGAGEVTLPECNAVCNQTPEACKSCIVANTCGDTNNGACDNACGGGNGGDTFETLMDACWTSTSCDNGYACVKASSASPGDDGVCVPQCGTSFDCDKLSGQKNIDDWICESDIQGASSACVPFGWGI